MSAPKDGNEPASSGRAKIRQRTEARLRRDADKSDAPDLTAPASQSEDKPAARSKSSTVTKKSPDRPRSESRTTTGDGGESVIDLRDDKPSKDTSSKDTSSTDNSSNDKPSKSTLSTDELYEDLDFADPVDLGDDWTTAELPEESGLFRLRRWASPATEHLASALHDTRRDLLTEVDRHRGKNPEWLDEAGRHFADATEACASGHIESGWRSLRHANRLSIQGASEVGVHARILALRAEAIDRVPGWTGMAITQILDDAAVNQEPDERRELVMRAAGLRDHSYASTHHRQAHRRREIAWSLIVLTASILGIVLLLVRDQLDFSDATIPSLSGWVAFAALLFGLTGASISAIHRVARSTTDAHDGGDDSGPSNLFRPMIGGAIAVVVAAAVAGGAIGPVTATVPLIALVAFVAGFSERLAG